MLTSQDTGLNIDPRTTLDVLSQTEFDALADLIKKRLGVEFEFEAATIRYFLRPSDGSPRLRVYQDATVDDILDSATRLGSFQPGNGCQSVTITVLELQTLIQSHIEQGDTLRAQADHFREKAEDRKPGWTRQARLAAISRRAAERHYARSRGLKKLHPDWRAYLLP